MGLFSKAETFEFKVAGMDCGGCERKVMIALTGITGVKKVEASASEGSVVVKAKGVDSQTISDAINDVGFTVQ